MNTQTQPWLQRYTRPPIELKGHYTLFAVDPGKKHCGLAFFDSGALVEVTLIREDGPLEVSLAAASWILKRDENPDVLVTEMQQIYPGIRASDPNDLLPLAEVVGGVHALVPAQTRIKPLPRDWKGTTPGDLFVERTLKAMSLKELDILTSIKCPKSMLHNVIDAIALGKFGVKRVGN